MHQKDFFEKEYPVPSCPQLSYDVYVYDPKVLTDKDIADIEKALKFFHCIVSGDKAIVSIPLTHEKEAARVFCITIPSKILADEQIIRAIKDEVRDLIVLLTRDVSKISN